LGKWGGIFTAPSPQLRRQNMSDKIFNRNVKIANGKLKYEHGTGTDSSQAVTINKPAGKITSSTTNLAADTSETITVTNKYCKTNSIVHCVVSTTGNGAPVISSVIPSNGSFTVVTRNVNASTALNAAYIIRFTITGINTEL